MKKIALFLILCLAISLLTGCADSPAPAETTATPTTPVTTEGPTETEAPADPSGIHPMLFHVTGEGLGELWLFGTIHVGDQRIPLALELVKPWLDRCDALAVEFDIVAYEKDIQAQMRDLAQFVYTDGTKVSDHMPQELFQQASGLLKEARLQPQLMENYNLAMWAQLVDQAALLTRTDFDMNIGMDRSLIGYCYEKDIPVRNVESPELQYGLLAGFSDELNLLLLENTLDNLEDYGGAIDQLYSAWLEGDYDHIVEVLNEEDQEEDLTPEQEALLEDYNDKMLTQRNLGMADKALEWLRAGDKVFFAVGAAHLVDDGGLVDLLRQAGCTVEQVVYGD